MKTKLSLAFAALFAAVIVYALFFRVSDEDRIRQKLTALEAAVKSGGPEPGDAARALRVQQAFSRIFAPRVQVDIPELESGEEPRDELAALVVAGEARIHALDVELDRVHLEIDPRAQPPRADVDALATVTGTASGDAMKRRSIYQVTIHLESLEGDWRITRIAAASTY